MKKENIFDKLKTDHDEVKEFLSKLENDPTNKTAFKQLEEELAIHDKSEEQTFYEPLKKKIPNLAILIEIGTKEHELVANLIQYIKKTKPSGEDAAVLISFLKKSLEGHIKKEENEVFKLAKEAFNSEEIEKITEAFEQKKESLK
jgi:hemerythrin-like domain-containing protein